MISTLEKNNQGNFLKDWVHAFHQGQPLSLNEVEEAKQLARPSVESQSNPQVPWLNFWEPWILDEDTVTIFDDSDRAHWPRGFNIKLTFLKTTLKFR